MSDFDTFLATSSSRTKAAERKVDKSKRARRVLEFDPYVYPFEKPSASSVEKSAPFSIATITPTILLPSETRRWIRNASDERAAQSEGCRFSEAVAQYTVDWIESNCILYEGDRAGDHIEIDDWQYEFFMQGWGWLFFDNDWAKLSPENLDLFKRSGQTKEQFESALQSLQSEGSQASIELLDGKLSPEVAKSIAKGWVRRYKKISGWVPKKNTKSPTLAASGFYTFGGDGEPGQKCFSIAKDGNQAMIAHNHAISFVRSNPKWSDRCRIDGTSGLIYDRKTKSSYSVICANQGEQKNRKEGINGSLFIDETHVVDENIMKVVSRAGISRRQPMICQLSTAGDNPQGYGCKEYENGKQNLKNAEEGLQYNFRLLHFAYEIPQDVTIEEMRDPANFDYYTGISNPTLGRVIRPNEIKEDWIDSCKSDTELIRFGMYRWNLWSKTGTSFVVTSDWKRCYKKFSLKDLIEYPCVAGVDVSRCRDMTASVLTFAVPETRLLPEDLHDPESELVPTEIIIPHIWPFAWIPESAVQRYANKIDLKSLANKKHLSIVKGRTIRPEIIAEHLNWASEKFDFRGVAADPHYLGPIASILEDTHGWDLETTVLKIRQSMLNISPAVEGLEGLILRQELAHNGNEVMEWQLGNIVVKEDDHGNRMFQKQKQDDYRKIDIWSGLCNSTFVMLNDPEMRPGTCLLTSV